MGIKKQTNPWPYILAAAGLVLVAVYGFPKENIQIGPVDSNIINGEEC